MHSGKKFIASYSGGKDSTLAIYRAIKQGMILKELVITYNTDEERSWFHGITESLINKISKEMNTPITLIKTTGEDYEKKFEEKLKQAKNSGIEVCIFGDIDIEDHLNWCKDRCEAAEIEAYFPLWQESRRKLVYEFIDLGFKTMITVVNNSQMSSNFAGQILTREVAEDIAKSGADICGENGEYHTFVFDGPLYLNPIEFEIGDIIKIDNYSIVPIL
jgi:uncharacterized protein (TIGR00290 family)